MREPIEDGGKLDEAEEGDGEFVVAGGDEAVRFDPAEEVFDLMAVPLVPPMEMGRLSAAAFGRDAAAGALSVQSPAEGIGIEAFIGHDPVATHPRQQRCDRDHMAQTFRWARSASPCPFVNRSRR
jgi:hypothetical protein